MEKVDGDKDISVKTYYMPHSYVLNEYSRTIKLQVMFDGSCKSDSGLSLNDIC